MLPSVWKFPFREGPDVTWPKLLPTLSQLYLLEGRMKAESSMETMWKSARAGRMVVDRERSVDGFIVMMLDEIVI